MKMATTVSDIEAAVARYASELPLFERVARTVKSEISAVANAESVSCTYSARAKDLRSFHKKIIEKKYTAPWEQVTDKAGVRVIAECPRDVDRMHDLILQKFGGRVLGVEDKRFTARPESFGYSGVHLQVETTIDGVARECEVQLRTGAQDLWSVMSHRLLYKPFVQLPNEMQHAAYRLGALVELFDEEVQRLIERETISRDDPALRLVSLAEGAFLTVAHSPSNRTLSLQFVQPIIEAFTSEEILHYDSLLDAFMRAEGAALKDLYAEYGPHSAVAYLPEYILFGQAESILLIERLSSQPHRLSDTWAREGLPRKYLEVLADAAGYSLP